ncbi:hypothetical protein E3N88_46296 [Mikania micrantha]|uniref:Pentacotripeptide-repeat region of PRORP domain-containing protein n=1 Tax=Mikania micrantha TaxID=192012 RepID=A0A5N6L6Y7_9ASTR|nr:hypothetical protein E3N88_46296 [Mikania micrantha]
MKYCFRSCQFDEGIEFFYKMKNKGHTYDVYSYCTVSSAFAKIGRLEEAHKCYELMIKKGIELDIVCYNILVNMYCIGSMLGEVYNLLYEIEQAGLKCDEYTHTALIDGLCRAGNIDGALKHLRYMYTLGFNSNLVAYNCMVDRLCKAGYINKALKIFGTMDVRDSITYTSLVHNLCKERRFLIASKVLLACLNQGMKLFRSTQRVVVKGLRFACLDSEARKLRSKIRLVRILQ